MNFELSHDQRAVRDAARDALAREDPLRAAREELDGQTRVDLWPIAKRAGWSGLMVAEDDGGAGLGAIDAFVVAIELGRVLAGVPLLGHSCGCALLAAAPRSTDGRLTNFATGEQRLAYVAAMPPTDLEESWTVDDISTVTRHKAPRVVRDGDSGTITGTVRWVPDAVGADMLIVAATDGAQPVAVLVDPAAPGVQIEDATEYDLTRRLAHLHFDDAAGTIVEGIGQEELRAAWFLAQAWIAAECVGSVEASLERSVAYACDRVAFGRPIGSYQAVKHGLVEMLRRMENTRSLVYYAGWAYAAAPHEFALAASAARVAGTEALDHAGLEQIVIHGGIGFTWEHDAPLYYRRAQVSRRLLGGIRVSADRVGEILVARARAAENEATAPG